MLRIDRNSKKLTRLNSQTMAHAELKERYDIQRMIRQSPDDFFRELGEDLLLIGEEVCPSEFCDDRIDLLALDRQGEAVIVEIKRGSHRLQLLQSLAYAAMIAKWKPEQFLARRETLAGKSKEDVEAEFEEFIEDRTVNLNASQRIVLIAEDYDFEVLVTAEWLSEEYGLDVRCYRLALHRDDSTEYLSVTRSYPPPELTEEAIQRRRKNPEGNQKKWRNWDEALGAVVNPDVAKFARQQLALNVENRADYRNIYLRIGGRRRWELHIKNESVYVWQYGRFDGDVEFWKKRLTKPDGVQPKQGGERLRFHLYTSEDCDRFGRAVTGEISESQFSASSGRDEQSTET